jgi:hypothetical protein
MNFLAYTDVAVSTFGLTVNVLKAANLLTASAVAHMAGVSRVFVWKAASRGQFDGISRTPGGQFRFTRGGAEAWALKIKKLRKDRNRRRAWIRRARFLEHDAKAGIATIHGFRAGFDIWYRRWPVEGSPSEVKRAILEELRAPAELALRLARELGVNL